MLDIIVIFPTTSSLALVSRKAQKFGPIGFQIIINNAANNAKSQYLKYVDDLTFAENRKLFETGELRKDLNEFSDWAKDNRLKLKGLAMIFSGQKNPLITFRSKERHI